MNHSLLATNDLSYLRAGAGERSVLLLHGWGAFKEIWWSTLAALAPRYCAFAPDLPGHGASTAAAIADLDANAERVAAFCAELGLRRVALVGHSMGGALALVLALRQPELVACLVLVDPAAEPDALPRYAWTYLYGASGWAALRFVQLGARLLSPLGQRVPHSHGSGWLLPWLRRGSYFAQHDPTQLHRSLHSLRAAQLVARSHAVACPTLVLSGQFDSLVPPALSQRLAEAIPAAQYRILPGALHNPMDERPRLFQRVLLDFLAATETDALDNSGLF